MSRTIIYFLSFLFPWKIRRVYLNYFMDFNISANAKIGFSLVIPEMLEMSEGSRIGHLNVVKGLDLLRLDACAILGNLNWVTGYTKYNYLHFSQCVDRDPSLIIEEHAAITNRHLIDCTDKVTIGRFSTFAGFRSQILTHSIDLQISQQNCKPVIIGDYCFVGTACVILGGSSLPSHSVLGANALLNSSHEETYALYGGVPAKKIKSIPKSHNYFHRKSGFVN